MNPLRKHGHPMRQPHTVLRFPMALGIYFLLSLSCFAGSSRQRAAAAIAVARVTLEIMDEQPVLPEKPKAESWRPKDQSLSELVKNDSSPATSNLLTPIRIEFAESTIISDVLPAQIVISSWERGCPICTRLENEIHQVLDPLGWSIGRNSTDQIRFVTVSQMEVVPKIDLYQNGAIIRTWNKYVDPGTLSQALRKAWDNVPIHCTLADAQFQSGVGGTIHAKHRIRTIQTWWRDNIGEGNTGTLIWDRSGAQTLPLLSKNDWSAISLFGTSGHIDLSADKAHHLPITKLGFGYQIRGRDILFHADPITIPGLAERLEPAVNRQIVGTSPVGFIDPLTAWNIFTMFQGLFDLLSPSCDLELPEQLVATATLHSETITVDFQQGPSVKLVALFTFFLNVKRVDITENSVRLFFTGSRFVKERTFIVQ